MSTHATTKAAPILGVAPRNETEKTLLLTISILVDEDGVCPDYRRASQRRAKLSILVFVFKTARDNDKESLQLEKTLNEKLAL